MVSGMKTAWLSNFHCKHCPGPLKFPFGSIATREIEQNRQRMVLSQLPVGIQPEGLNMLLNMNYSRSPWYILSDRVSAFYCTTADTLKGWKYNNLCNWCKPQNQCLLYLWMQKEMLLKKVFSCKQTHYVMFTYVPPSLTWGQTNVYFILITHLQSSFYVF